MDHGVDERLHPAGVLPAYGGNEVTPAREYVARAQSAQVLLTLGPSWRQDGRTGGPGEWYGGAADPDGRTHDKDSVAGARSSASTVMSAVLAVSAAAPAVAVSMWAGWRVSVCPPVTTSPAQAPSRNGLRPGYGPEILVADLHLADAFTDGLDVIGNSYGSRR